MLDRLVKLWKGFVGLFIAKLETASPRALLEAEANALKEAEANYNKKLAMQAALVNKLKMQLERQKKELDLETSKARALLSAQRMDEAGRAAMRVKTLTAEINDNEGQMKSADELYVTLTRQRNTYLTDAQRRIEAIKLKMTKAEIAESQAKLAEMASTTAFDMAGSGATLQRLEEKLDDRLAQAQGRARVASDQATSGSWSVKADEEKALEAQALSEFAATMGMEVPGMHAAPPTNQTRVLGPQDAGRELGPQQGA